MRLLAAILLCLPALQLRAQELTTDIPTVIYDSSSQASASLGYRDNILYSSVAQESSAFSRISLDTTLLRIADSGSLFVLYLLGEDTRYWSAPSVDYEQLLTGTAQYTTPIGEKDEIGLEANYLYMHQILDASDTEDDLYRILVEGHTLTLRPHWKHTFGKGWATKVEAGARRQTYLEDLDDYSEVLGKVSLIYTYGNRSEASMGWQYLVRHYDTRTRINRSGDTVVDTDLRYHQNEFVSRWRHNWDSDRQWQTTTRFNLRLNRDNGSGYSDYDQLMVRQQIRWKKGDWSVKANASVGWTLYDIQKIGNEQRERSYSVVEARVERQIGKTCWLHIVAEQEWNQSNDPLDEYQGWMANTGITFEF